MLAVGVVSDKLLTPERRACDACRKRHVKCYYKVNEATCDACILSSIPCTDCRPRRNRGPKPKYVAARHQMHSQRQPSDLESPRSVETSNTSSLEVLAGMTTIRQVLDDWLEFVYPVAPILHRASFLQELEDPIIRSTPCFVNLVFSLCASLVSTLRRRSIAYDGVITVERCYQLATQTIARSVDLDGDTCNLLAKVCVTKYNFAVSLATARGMDNPVSYQLISEAAMATSYILHYRTESLSVIDSELLKRLYWLCFAHQCTQALHGRPTLVFSEVDRLTLLQPREINDAELSPIRPGDEDWHGNWTSYIPGLNILSRLFMTWFQSQHGPHAHSYSRLQTSFELATAALDSIPAELRWRGGLSRPRRGNFGTDVQMVNLHITHIHIKAFLLDQIDRAAAVDGHGSSNNWVPTARQDLFTDMLAIVYQMPEEVLVANGYSLIAKLRDIGLALLSGKGVNSVEVVESLNRLLAKLERLDFPPALSDSSPSGMDNGV